MGQETMASLAMTSAMLKGGANSIKDVFEKLSALVDNLDKQSDNVTLEKKEAKKQHDRNNDNRAEVILSLKKQQEEHHRESSSRVERNHSVRSLLQIQQMKAQWTQLHQQQAIHKDGESANRKSKRMQGEMLHMAQQNWVATTSVTKELVRIHSVLVGDQGKAAEYRLARMSKERGLALERESELESIFRSRNLELFGSKGSSNLSEFNVKIKENAELDLDKQDPKILALKKIMEDARKNSAKVMMETLKEVSEKEGWDQTINKSKIKLPKGTLLHGLLAGLPGMNFTGGGGATGATGGGLYQQQRAPKGGVDVNGKFYNAGQLLPHSENKPYEGKGVAYQSAGAAGGAGGNCCGEIGVISDILKNWNTRDAKGEKTSKVKAKEAQLDGGTYQQQRAPKGGITFGGKKYTSGQLLPHKYNEAPGMFANMASKYPIATGGIMVGTYELMKKIIGKISAWIAKYMFAPTVAMIVRFIPFLAPVFAMGPVGWIVSLVGLAVTAEWLWGKLQELDNEFAGMGRTLDPSGKMDNMSYLKQIRKELRTPTLTDDRSYENASGGFKRDMDRMVMSIGEQRTMINSEAVKKDKDLPPLELKVYKALTTKGSAYVHDTHAEVWLSKIFGILSNKGALKSALLTPFSGDLSNTVATLGDGGDFRRPKWMNAAHWRGLPADQIRDIQKQLKSGYGIDSGSTAQHKYAGGEAAEARKVLVEKQVQKNKAAFAKRINDKNAQKKLDIKDGQSKGPKGKGQFNIFKGLDKFFGPTWITPEFLLDMLLPTMPNLESSLGDVLLNLVGGKKAHAKYKEGSSGFLGMGSRPDKGTPLELFNRAIAKSWTDRKIKTVKIGGTNRRFQGDAQAFNDMIGIGAGVGLRAYNNSAGAFGTKTLWNTEAKYKNGKMSGVILPSLFQKFIKAGLIPEGALNDGSEREIDVQDIIDKVSMNQLAPLINHLAGGGGGGMTVINNNTSTSNSPTAVVLQSTAHAPVANYMGGGSSVSFS